MKLTLIIFIWLLSPLILFGQNQSPNFKHITLENGLSQTSISCIIKDSRGFMWFGTEDGLNKYDGKNFTVYRHIPNDTTSLSSSYINSIVEQEDGFLWIGTKKGLNYFNPNSEKFTRYLHDSNNPNSLINNEINILRLSDNGHLLIGTSNGLNMYNSNTGFSKFVSKNSKGIYNVMSMSQDDEGNLWVLSSGMVEKITFENGMFSDISSHKPLKNSIKYTMQLDSLNLWIGSSIGLIKLNLQNSTVDTLKFYGLNGAIDSRNQILALSKREKGKLWIGTYGGGLIDFDKRTGDFHAILHDPYNRLSPNSSSIRSIFQDEKNILWLGTYGGGINKHDPNQFNFEHYKHNPGDGSSLSENTVRSILLDKDNQLWVGTHNGLNRLNTEKRNIKTYRYDKNNLLSISSNIVRAICEDSKGIIWIGTWENGLNSFNKKTGNFRRYTHFPLTNKAIGQVRSLAVDRDDNIWVGGSGLWKFNVIKNQFSSNYFEEMNIEHNDNSINSLYFDGKGLLWIGTSKDGLSYLDPSSNSIKKYSYNSKDTLSISHNYVTAITEDKNGSLWIGTYGGGLNKLNTSKGFFQHYNTGNGLLNDVIYGVLADNDGFIWFTSNAGLGRINPNRGEFRYFGVEQGIQSEEFNAGAYFKSNNDELFFGGINGFNSFYPNAVNNENKTSNIVFTNFQLLDDKEIQANEVLDKHISRAENIKLNYNQNTISLKFAELNYSDNIDHNYEYQLEGFDKNWEFLGKRQQITIGNLSPGNYLLSVRVHNDITKKTSINISISPPVWQSNWAYFAYTALIALLIYLIYRSTSRTKYIRKQFELKIKNWENGSIPSEQLFNPDNVGTMLPLKKVKTISRNQKFLDRVTKIVEDHLEDSQFDVERFAGEMFMSRSQLHRKLKIATGYSTTEFIRLIRLKRAAQLLSGNTGTVSEIAYKVGFDNIGYFSKCFKETFGKPPSQYDK